MNEICPEKKIRAIPSQPVAGTINITVPNGKFRINEIEYKTVRPVLFRLLLCREEKIRLKLPTNPQKSACPFPEQYNLEADIDKSQYACREPRNDIAHVYYRHEELQESEQSCIVVFINNKSEKIVNIAQRFINTVNWLQIKSERPYFRIVYIYNTPLIDINSVLIKNRIQDEIRKVLPSFKQEICKIVEFRKEHKKLKIDFNDMKFFIESA